jgi:two-component system, OmpR family, sensor histidine kinase CpxA
MKPRLHLYTKVLFVALLNVGLLGLALEAIVRAQFRVDAGSFLLAPAESRIMTLAHEVALELGGTPPDQWDQVLERYGQGHGVEVELFGESGERVAGRELAVPPEVAGRIPRRQQPRRNAGPPREGRQPDGREPPPERPRVEEKKQGADRKENREPAPPLFLTATSNPTGYWAGARIPMRLDPGENPHPGTLLLMSRSLVASRLFFDPMPWVTIGLAVVLISAACWLPFIRGMTRSISQMTRAAGQIAEGHFEIHVSDRRRDEIGQLGAAVNRMAARLAGFVRGQKAFLGGIAHELCTPIATIQFGLVNLERRVRPEQKDAVADIQEEVQHMSALVNELLSFTRASGIEGLNVKLTTVNVAATVARVLERESSPAVNVALAVDEKLNVEAEPEHLFRALSNVVRNAIRYAGHAGPIRIAARAEDGAVLVTVSDSGPGVSEESLEQIFAPFYRVDAARSQDTGGLGLGLAVVRNCVENCGGAVRCRNLKPSGLEVEIRLKQS